jgi:predicted permease
MVTTRSLVHDPSQGATTAHPNKLEPWPRCPVHQEGLGLEDGALLAVVAMAAPLTAQNVLVYATQYERGQALARDAGMLTMTVAVPASLVITVMLG